MSVYDQEIDYREAVEGYVEEIRRVAREYGESLAPELARAVLLVTPWMAYPGNLGITTLDAQLRNDYVAGMEFAGYHGYSVEQVETEATWVRDVLHSQD